MDLEEWELLPDDGFLQIHDDGGKKIFSRKFGGDPKNIFKANYFTVDPPENPRMRSQIVPVPIQLGPGGGGKPPAHDVPKLPIEPCVITDQETVSQVFFKKMKENEFADMKMDSPKAIVPQIEDRSEGYKGEAMEGNTSPKMKTEKDILAKKIDLASKISGEEDTWEEKNAGLNIWKWGLTGIGAICSFGVAAATICVIIFQSHQKTKYQQNQKLRFEIYADEKRIKQVVDRATKLNEAISAVRGVPLTRAHITIGGCYDGL
ncbi:hypothetical protein NMG60_11003848 [Bertholletia excelsa]